MVNYQDTEIWRPIQGYEGRYDVSNHGRVKSLKRKCRSWHHGTEGIRKVPGKIILGGGKRYRLVQLRDGKKGRYFKVHRLVLEAFVGPCPDGMEACHNDGNSFNNHVGNLRWDTPINNHADRKSHGTNMEGQENGNAKLTNSDVEQIKHLLKHTNLYLSEIAKMFNVSTGLISAIKQKRIWRHI